MHQPLRLIKPVKYGRELTGKGFHCIYNVCSLFMIYGASNFEIYSLNRRNYIMNLLDMFGLSLISYFGL